MIERRFARLADQLRRWGPAEVEGALRRLHAQRERPAASPARRWLPWLTAAAAFAVLAVVAARSPWQRAPSRPTESLRAPPTTPQTTTTTLVLEDGSEVSFDRGSQVAVSERGPSRVVVALRAGEARFRVRHDVRRVFRVDAGVVQIDDLGTTFSARREGERVRVLVTEGSVAVSFPSGAGGAVAQVRLAAGESGIYPPSVLAAPLAPPADAADVTPARAQESRPRHSGSWRELAHAGNLARAFRQLARTGAGGVRDEPADLLLAADVARLSGHPAAAVAPLRLLVDRHAGDARAPAAAFTLGWVLMNDLRRPRAAAAAFMAVERLAPHGNLAEDAAARAAEAWYGAGDLARASVEVHRYSLTYPQGRHRAVLERLVGVP